MSIGFGDDFGGPVSEEAAGLGAAQLDEIIFLFNIGGPGEFDLKAGPVVEADEANREIFHVENPVFLGFAENGVGGIGKCGMGKLAVG